MILTLEGLSDLLKFGSVDGATGTDPLLPQCKVALFVNNVNPTAQTVWADLEECAITGYARSAVVTWDLPVLSSETGLPAIFGDLKTFDMTTQTDPEETIFGYALVATITAVEHLVAVQSFLTPILPASGSAIGIIPRVGLSQQAVTPSGDVAFS